LPIVATIDSADIARLLSCDSHTHRHDKRSTVTYLFIEWHAAGSWKATLTPAATELHYCTCTRLCGKRFRLLQGRGHAVGSHSGNVIQLHDIRKRPGVASRKSYNHSPLCVTVSAELS